MTNAKKTLSAVSVLFIALAVVMCAVFFPATAVAETATGDYMVNAGSTLTLYSNNDQPVQLFQVPATYYVTLKSAAAQGGYYTVTYDGADYKIKTEDLSHLTLHDTKKYGAVPAENMSFTLNASAVFPQGEYNAYTYSNGTMSSSDPAKASEITEVYGIFTTQNTSYYRVHIHKTVYDVPIDADIYIPASSAAAPYSSYTAASVPANSYEQTKAEIDKQASQNTPPDTNEEGSADVDDPQNTDNNLERIILSVIIAVLCVAVVLLIFRPGRKKKA